MRFVKICLLQLVMSTISAVTYHALMSDPATTKKLALLETGVKAQAVSLWTHGRLTKNEFTLNGRRYKIMFRMPFADWFQDPPTRAVRAAGASGRNSLVRTRNHRR